MKAILAGLLALGIVSSVSADQRFETTGGFCHFVTPEGFQNGNDDNEVFYANCLNSIRQNSDGTGNGSTIINVKFPLDSAPFTESYETSFEETGIDCVMVDSNGTTYVSQDWNSTYEYRGITRRNKIPSIKYTLICRNGNQQ